MQTADGGGWTSNTDGNTEITAVDFNHDLCCLVSVYCCNHDEEQVAILTQTPPCDPDHVVTDRQVIKLTGTTLTENIVVLKASLEQKSPVTSNSSSTCSVVGCSAGGVFIRVDDPSPQHVVFNVTLTNAFMLV